MKLVKIWLKNRYPLLMFTGISVLVLVVISFNNLASVTNSRLSQPEIDAFNASISGRVILDNPLFLPFKIPTYLLIKTGMASVFSLRAISALFGVGLAIFFYLLIKKWFSAKIAWLATLLLATSSLYLNYTRLAVPYVLLPFGLLLLLWSSWWIYQSKNIRVKILIASVLVITCFYIPGLIWFGIIFMLLQKHHLKTMFAGISKIYIFSAFTMSSLLILPLLIAGLRQPSIFLQWLALPLQLDLMKFAENLLSVPLSLLARSELDPVFGLGRLPYLDVLTICLAILGSYAFAIRHKLMRTRALILTIVIAWILISFDNQVKINLLLPVVYTAVAGGIMFLLQQWFSVFPKNPVARSIGVALLVGVISISAYYNSVRYFMAWANNPISQQSFQSKIPEVSDIIKE